MTVSARPVYIADVLATSERLLTGRYELVRLSLDDREALAATVLAQHAMIQAAGLRYPDAPAPNAREVRA